MTALVFVDTNVLVYAKRIEEAGKQRQALHWLDHLWREQTGRVSVQVLNEYYVTMTRKVQPALSLDEAWGHVRALLSWKPQAIDADVLQRAREIDRKHRLNWWDSLIVAAAQAQGCALLLTEDLQDQAVYGGVTVRSPFTMGVEETAAIYGREPALTQQHRPRGRPRRAPTAAA